MEGTTEKILQIRVESAQAIQMMSDYTTKVKELKDEEKDLKKQIDELDKTDADYAQSLDKLQKELVKTKEEEKAYQQQVSQLSKTIQDQLKIEDEQLKIQAKENGSLKDLRAELSRATKEFDNMSRAEREGAKGQELQKHINEVTDELKKNEEATQRYQRNVGNYKSALQQTGQAFSAAGVNASAFNKTLNVLNANPFVKIVTVLVGILAAVIKSFKGNEEASMRLKEALAPLQPIIDAIKRGFEAFAGVLVKVVKGAIEGITQAVGWMLQKLQDLGNWFGADWHFADRFKEMQKEATDAYLKLAMMENAYVKKKRKWVTESAELDKKIADLREKASDKEKYTAQERLKYLDQAIALETKKAEQEKKLAEMNLKILQEKAKHTANSAEENDKLAEAERAVIEADTNLSNVKRTLNKQRMAAVDAIKAEAAAAEKEAEDYQKLVLQETRKAEDALNNLIKDAIEKRTKIENARYERNRQDLQAKMDAEKAAHEEETELYKAYAQQMEALDREHTANMNEISLAAAQKQAEQHTLEWQNRINEARMRGEEYMQLELEQLRERLENLHQLEEESDAEFKARQLEVQQAYISKKKQLTQAEIQIEKAKFSAMASFVGDMSEMLTEVGSENKVAVELSKNLALAEVAIKQGVAIAAAVAASAEGDPYTYALRVAAAIVSTVTAMAKAITSINSAKFAKGTSYVNGPGTETSDSIPAMLSRGEGVVTARANRMFPGLVQAMNDMAAGIATPARVFNSSSIVNNYTTQSTLNEISRNTGKRLVVSVEEIHRVEDNVEVIENLSTI